MCVLGFMWVRFAVYVGEELSVRSHIAGSVGHVHGMHAACICVGRTHCSGFVRHQDEAIWGCGCVCVSQM